MVGQHEAPVVASWRQETSVCLLAEDVAAHLDEVIAEPLHVVKAQFQAEVWLVCPKLLGHCLEVPQAGQVFLKTPVLVYDHD